MRLLPPEERADVFCHMGGGMKFVKVARNPLKKRHRVQRRLEHKREVMKLMPENSVCAEVGVWKGDLSSIILTVVAPKKLHLIDPWAFMTDEVYETAWYGGAAAASQSDMDHIYNNVANRFDDQIQEGTVQVHRCPSEESTHLFPNEYFDWVYIDGNHLYEFVKKDLYGYFPKIKAGGCIAGDDYASGGWHDGGVKRAVEEFAATEPVELKLLPGTQFILYKK